MYPYHGKIKQRIQAGELTGWEKVNEYNGIKPCLLLYFKTEPFIRPVRSHRFEMYEEILSTQTNNMLNNTQINFVVNY